MIGTESISCISVERYCYLFTQVRDLNLNIGRFFEQENDAGERQYVYEIYQDKLTPEIRILITLPGIDLMTGESVYVRNTETPYFVECSVPPKFRPDAPIYLKSMGLEYYDEFEHMMRSRAITHHTNCYLGRTATDFFDAKRARRCKEFWDANLPNLAESPENVFHKAERLFSQVDYDVTIK